MVCWILALYAVVFVLIVAPSFLTPLMIVRTFGFAPVLKWNSIFVAFFIASYGFFSATTPYLVMVGLLFVGVGAVALTLLLALTLALNSRVPHQLDIVKE